MITLVRGISGNRRIKRILTILLLAIIAVFWWLMATPSSPGKVFGLYSLKSFLGLFVLSYTLIWGIYFLLNTHSVKNKLLNLIMASFSILFVIGLFEAPAFLGLIDYRQVFSPPESELFTRYKPWENPKNILDTELGWIHRPNHQFSGETVGDLVTWLGIPTSRRYEIDVKYDRNGFRNDHDIDQASIVALGDSFLDWPLIPDSDLLTSQLSRSLQLEVANLSQAAYGPQQELVVLHRYGLKLQPEIVLWFFFEGNDLLDIPRYDQLVQNWEIETKHNFKERSFTKNALLGLVALTEPELDNKGEEARRRSCRFLNAQDKEEDLLYFAYAGMPLSKQELSSLERAKNIFLEASQISNEKGSKFLLIYIPTKFRIYHDFCEFPTDGYGYDWSLNDLPQRLQDWAISNGIPFLDLSGPLEEAASRGELVFYPDDGHWNSKGNQIAANTLTQMIKERAWLLLEKTSP